MRETVTICKYNMKAEVWASICTEEIKNEIQTREFYKEKCNSIIKEYFNEICNGDFSYFIVLNKDEERKCVEYQLRYTYWNYFRIANLHLLNYSQFFRAKINLYSKKISENFELNNNERAKEDMKTKLYINELELRLENNMKDLKDIRNVIESEEKKKLMRSSKKKVSI